VGCNAKSAINGTLCETDKLFPCASSFATPKAAAAAIIARQYFIEGFHPTGGRQLANSITPSGALLKAVLLNFAIPKHPGRKYPNDFEGWGNLDLSKFLPLGDAAQELRIFDVRNRDGLKTGDNRSFQLKVTDDSKPLKITLVWTEPPGASGADDPVVNDLDLIVTAPDGKKYLGNVFADGSSVQGGISDSINNTEMVLLPRPLLGTWTATIKATRVVASLGSQGFALVVRGRLARLSA
jgi:hypothetical protein